MKDLIRSITNLLRNSRLNNSDDYDKKYMKMKFNSDDDLLLKNSAKTL